MERSNTEGAEFRSSYEETRTANAGVAPEAVRLRARGAQPVNEVSTLQNRETELQGQLQNLRQESARVNDRMNQIQITHNPMSASWSFWSAKLGGKKSVYRTSRRRNSLKYEGRKYSAIRPLCTRSRMWNRAYLMSVGRHAPCFNSWRYTAEAVYPYQVSGLEKQLYKNT